jgi:hypothetical protein
LGALTSPFDGEGEAIRDPEDLPPLSRNLGTTVRADDDPRTECTHEKSICFGSLNIDISRESNMDRVVLAWPTSLEGPYAALEAFDALSLTQRKRHEGLGPALPPEVDGVI